MFATGHMATAYLAHRCSGWSLGFLVAAAILPDVVDKGLGLLGLFPTGRHVAHNLFAVAASAVLVRAWWGSPAGTSWLAGYALHLLGDLPFSGEMPWFFPFEFGAWHNSVEGVFLNMSLGQMIMDLSVSAVSAVLLIRGALSKGRLRIGKGGARVGGHVGSRTGGELAEGKLE